ncbi:hypothetical protein [uncultured Hymenobacter sp.]|uniref:hypothetical protein n=1 Tax=uncultured Hymenobacter sp. TaxID=170016 RepID=UPI0035C976AB
MIKARGSYYASTTKAVGWEVIEGRYTELINRGWRLIPLLDLVQKIKSSPLSTKLYAFTSLDRLVVSIYPDIEWERETLHVLFDQHRQEWEFKYFAKPYQKPEFVRQYPADAGKEKFDQFINMIRW